MTVETNLALFVECTLAGACLLSRLHSARKICKFTTSLHEIS